jgi:PAS domain S-box-containing protein
MVARMDDIEDGLAGGWMTPEERFRQLFERGVDAVWVTDAAALVRYVSPAARRLLGAAAPEVGASVLDGVHPDDRAPLTADLARLGARSGSFASIEYRVASGDGSFRWIESTVSNLLEDPGLGALVWSQRDLGEKRPVPVLPADEGRLADILARVSDGILALDRSWRVTYVNPSALRLLGLAPEELVGQDLWERLWQLHGTPFELHLRRAMAEGIAVQFEALGPVSGRWLEVDAFPTAEGLSIVERDVTARRRSAAELARLAADLEERLRELDTALSVSPVAILMARDPECREVVPDARFAALVGVPLDTNLSIAPPAPAVPLIHLLQGGREIPQEEAPLLRAARRGERVPATEYDLRRPDGSLVHLVVGASPLFDPAGRVRGAVAACVDVTERKRTEGELRRAKRSADEANRARTRLLAALSHELRTPLTPALAVLSRIEETGAAPEALAADLGRVRRAIEIEARLIDDLLDLTGLERGEIALAREPVLLDRVIEQAIAIAAGAFAGADVDLRGDLAGDAQVDADAARLTQVFWALLDHALRATPPGRAVVLRTAVEGDEVVAEVAATGAGIAPEEVPHLFAGLGDEPPSGLRPGGGAALSLAVAAAIVERHGGRLTAASPAGEPAGHPASGVTFTLRLPRAPRPAEAAAPAPAAVPASGPPRRILLVEDHADAAEALAELLRLDGHQVTVATSLAEARERVGDGIDLVISDLGLPDGSGHELMSALAGRGLPAIALSGFGTAEDRDASRAAGFRLHLTKPVDLKALRQAVRAIFEAPGAASLSGEVRLP